MRLSEAVALYEKKRLLVKSCDRGGCKKIPGEEGKWKASRRLRGQLAGE